MPEICQFFTPSFGGGSFTGPQLVTSIVTARDSTDALHSQHLQNKEQGALMDAMWWEADTFGKGTGDQNCLSDCKAGTCWLHGPEVFQALNKCHLNR